MSDSREPLFESSNPHRIYRDPSRGVLGGVCAGLADYLGVDAWKVRLATIIALLIFPPQTVLIYGLAMLFIRKRPARPLYRNTEEEAFWRSLSGRPSETFYGLRHKFRELDERLAGMERTVTSDEFRLEKEIRDLER